MKERAVIFGAIVVLLGLVACTEPNPAFGPQTPPASDAFVAADGFVSADAGNWSDGGAAADSGPACGPSTCNGCCTAQGLCVPGDQHHACGGGGGSCSDCSAANQVCDPGQRVCTSLQACGPQNCSGCCSGGICLAGTSVNYCGSGGSACLACAAEEACDGQRCIATDPPTYQILLQSASLAGGGWAACYEQSCDLYVELKVANKKAKSVAIDDNNSPVWNPPALMLEAAQPDLIAATFDATLFDSDYGPDQTVGTCSLQLTPSLLAAGSATVPCFYGSSSTPGAPSASVVFAFVKK